MAIKTNGDKIEIIEYTEALKEFVKTLNTEWLEKYFRVEDIDVIQLSDPTGEIINKGGRIYYALYNGNIVGTVSLLRIKEGIYELGKMAVTGKAQGLGIGTLLMDHCFTVARQNNIHTLVLYSNTKLNSAIYLYKKYGFTEVSLEAGHYERANIKMEKRF